MTNERLYAAEPRNVARLQLRAAAAMPMVAPEAGLSMLPSPTPSVDELLALYAHASASHQQAEAAMKQQVSSAIAGKNNLTNVSSGLQGLNYTKEGGDTATADAKAFIENLDRLLAATTDPNAREALQQVIAIARTGGDTIINREEAKKMETILQNSVATIDSDLQLRTLHLKEANDKFSAITSIVKEIMDSNARIFDKIMARG